MDVIANKAYAHNVSLMQRAQNMDSIREKKTSY